MADIDQDIFLSEENPNSLRKHILGLETLLELTRSLMVIQDRKTLDGFLLLTAMGLLSVSRAVLLTRDPNENKFHIQTRGLRESEVREQIALRPSGVFARRMRVARALAEIRPDGLPEREARDIEILRSHRIRYAIPIRVKDKLNAILLLGERVHAGALTPFEDRMLRSILDIAGIVMDNTELYDDLRNANRTMEEQNERLKELDRLKTQFLANVGHELRTPITCVIGFAECLRYPDLDDRKRIEFADSILEQGARLSNLIDQVLDLSEITVQSLKVEPREADLNEIVQDVAASLRRDIDSKRIVLELALSPSLPKSYLDPERTKRVVKNLLDNAIKFSHADGKVRITSESDGEGVALKVSDQGVGIPAEELDSIFDAFRQVDGSETRAYGGAGIGLSLVKELVESQNGSVAVASSPGEGSTFTVRLPLGPRATSRVNAKKRSVRAEDPPEAAAS